MGGSLVCLVACPRIGQATKQTREPASRRAMQIPKDQMIASFAARIPNWTFSVFSVPCLIEPLSPNLLTFDEALLQVRSDMEQKKQKRSNLESSQQRKQSSGPWGFA